MMRRAAIAAACLVAAGPAFAQPVTVPLDNETIVGGVPVACTGVGQTKLDPKWRAYTVRVEFADAQSAYLGDVQASLFAADGRPIAVVRCEGPWVLFRPGRGRFHIEGSLTGQSVRPQTADIAAPAAGQIRVVLHFPDA
jgi:hypothetical protein